MKKTIFILSCLFSISFVYATEFEFIYSNWSSVFPEGVESFRIQSEDRYLFSRINEQGDYEQTDEYYTELEGYERIEESKKTFYRVINNSYVVFNRHGQLVLNDNECKKVFCVQVQLEKYEEHSNEIVPPVEEKPPETINPETYDGIYKYLAYFFICLIIIILKIKNKSSYVESL